MTLRLPLRPALWVITALCALAPATAQRFDVHPDRSSGVYAAGDTVHWTVTWQGDEIPPPARYVVKLGGIKVTEEGELAFADGTARLVSRIDEPNALLLEVSWEGEEQTQRELAGILASPQQIQPAAGVPDDFDAFWAAKIAELAAVPMNTRLESGEAGQDGVDYWKIWMDNIRGTQIQGQLARPAGATENLPALLIVQWAGVYPLQKPWAVDRAAEGWLTLNILAHDLPIDEPMEFYQEQRRGALSDYAGIGADDREESYFLRMYLSCYRAVEYLKTRPEWNGETLVVMGTSQGGQQTLVTAGLHPEDLTAALALVPAGADMLAPEADHAPAFPRWYTKTAGRDAAAVHQTSRYFDAANFATRIKVPVLVGVGLEDVTCPPATIFAATNQIATHTEVVVLPISGHQNVNGSQEPYNDRAYRHWLPALREGRPLPMAQMPTALVHGN